MNNLRGPTPLVAHGAASEPGMPRYHAVKYSLKYAPEFEGFWCAGGQGRIHDEPDGGYQTGHQPIRFRVIGAGHPPGRLVTPDAGIGSLRALTVSERWFGSGTGRPGNLRVAGS
jgi:hypothetical protein